MIQHKRGWLAKPLSVIIHFQMSMQKDDWMKITSYIFSLFFIYSLLTGCNQFQLEGPANESIYPQPMNMSTSEVQRKINQDDAERATHTLLKKHQVKWVRAVESKDLLMVAVELKHWNTFESKKLTKEMNKELEKEFKSKKVEVTTDHKIFIELEKLEEKINNDDISKKKLDKELKKIQKLMKEQT